MDKTWADFKAALLAWMNVDVGPGQVYFWHGTWCVDVHRPDFRDRNAPDWKQNRFTCPDRARVFQRKETVFPSIKYMCLVSLPARHGQPQFDWEAVHQLVGHEITEGWAGGEEPVEALVDRWATVWESPPPFRSVGEPRLCR